MDDIQLIVEKLNQPPFSKNLRLVRIALGSPRYVPLETAI
jgi:hypothetical protein